MRCAVSFLAVIILSIAVGVMALYIIWITENEDCVEPNYRCFANGKCIKPKDVCNHVVDCTDGQDEAPINCNDLTTTNEMLNSMAECINSTLQLDNSTSVVDMPEGCIYLGVNQSTPIGIKCYLEIMNGSWTQIPWHEFDMFARTISIDNGALDTAVLRGQSEILDGNGMIMTGDSITPREFPLLNKLYIDKNRIESVDASAFSHIKNVCWFSLRRNGIRNLSHNAFCPMLEVRMLKMSENKLHLTGFQFKNMPLLRILHLDYNEIREIGDGTFSQLTNLTMLNISHNRIKFIHENAFRHNLKLIELDLTANRLEYLSPSVFQAQLNLRKLYISSNPLLFLPSALFAPLHSLRSLNIETFDISQIDLNLFNFTRTLDLVYFKKFSYCRFVPRAQRCYPHSDGLSSTSNLLIGQSRIMVWLVGLLTVLGNISVLANRWCGRRSAGRAEISDILNIFVTNLAMADFLMGIYLLILACKDVQFRGMYSVKASDWGTSWLCSIIGILAMISSEVSLLILTIMSLERYLTIGGPFSQRQNLNTNLAQASMLIIWVFVCTLALAPAFQWQGGVAFYGSTGLCFPIHLDDRYPVGWQYTTFVFIGVNSCCLALITISYSMLFYTVRKTQRRTPLLVKNIELASRFFLMVFTDVLCWAPIIILKANVLCGYELSKEIIGWAVIYVLPLNSAVNPILYTFSTNEVRHAMTLQINRLLENFELNQLITSQNHANGIELQGLSLRAWFSRLVPRRRESSNQSGNNPAVTGTTENSEVTHSICPTIMTTENSCVVGGEGGGDALNNCTFNQCQKNYYNSATGSGDDSHGLSGKSGGESNVNINNLNSDNNLKSCNNRLSPSVVVTNLTSSSKFNKRSCKK